MLRPSIGRIEFVDRVASAEERRDRAPFSRKDYNHAKVRRHWVAMAWLNGEITEGQW